MSVTEDARAQHFLSLLVPAFTKYAGKAIIRPFLRGQPARWGEVTFREWSLQLAAARLYWLRVLPELGLQPADVVGLWLTGKEYTDLLNISSVSAAGYVPQLFSPVFTSGMIHTLLNRSNACGLIYDPRVARDVAGCLSNIPTTTALNAESLSALVASCGRGLSEEDLPFVGERQTAAIFHSSGTTCGLPKLIPTSHLLLRVFITEKFPDCSLDNTQDSSNIFNSLGSLAHVGSFQAFHGAAALGCTTVQASSMAMGSTELRDMVRETGLNRLVQYGTFVAAHIRAAMTDPELAGVLRGLRQVLYTGVALGREEERWAREQGVRLMAMYGTSETGPLLISKGGSYPLRPCRGAQPIFVPYNASSPSSSKLTSPEPSNPNPNPHTSTVLSPESAMSTTPTTRPELFEIVVAPSAPDAPPASLFSADGLWHTQDLFVVAPHGDDAPQYPHSERARPDPSGGRGWVYKGRAGDWIKTVTGFVDTRAIEDAVRRECADIVGDALVVGSGRIHPVLLVETLAAPTQPPDESLALRPHAPDGHTMNTSHAKHVKEAKLATEIVRRLEPLCGTLFPYERIARPHQVLVLPPGALLRNREKGNLRRDACEEAFREQIDAVFVSRG